MKSFASDNYSPVLPEVLNFLATTVNRDHQRAYGHDEFTARAQEIIKNELHTPDADVHFVMTGTAANVLSVKQSLRSTQSVIVTSCSHLETNETGAPEAISQSKLLAVSHHDGKIDLDQVQLLLNQERDIIPHTPRPRMMSVAQATEYGTVYTLDELKKISEFCKQNNLLLHLDLCRVYNAAVFLNCSISDIVSAAQPDIASIGGTKNGLLMAEAVVIFNPNLREDFELLQKQSMQLYSKMRYLSGQFIPFFEQKLWLRAATQANQACQLLAQKLSEIPAVKITRPVETNQMFAILPANIIPTLQAEYPFYIWDVSTNEVRLVTSFDTTQDEVENFSKRVRELTQ